MSISSFYSDSKQEQSEANILMERAHSIVFSTKKRWSLRNLIKSLLAERRIYSGMHLRNSYAESTLCLFMRNNVKGCVSTSTLEEEHGVLKEQDRLLPIANVGRIMKKILPPNAKVSKEAKETMQECVSEFISFVTGEASDRCHKEKRKTVNGDDVCWAMSSLGFDEYSEPLKRYLDRYRELEGEKANQNRGSSNEERDHEKSAYRSGEAPRKSTVSPTLLKFYVTEKSGRV